MAKKLSAPASPPARGWAQAVGTKGVNLVTVYERLEKSRIVHLRWNDRGQLRRESLRRRLPWQDGSAAVAQAQLECVQLALAKSAALLAAPALAETQADVDRPLVGIEAPDPHPSSIGLRDGLLAAHAAIYPGPARQTQHAKEQLTAIDALCHAFQDKETWADLPANVIRPFVERRAQLYREGLAARAPRRGLGGVRQTQKALAFLYQAGRHLASEQRMLSPLIAPRGWLKLVDDMWHQAVGPGEIRTSANDLRYSAAERDALLAALSHPDVDPRLRVAVTMGSGSYRLGQVIRMRRPHLELDREQPYGRMTIESAGKKQGGGFLLTKQERIAWEMALTAGYLADFEKTFGPRAQYPLFPQGQIRPDGTIAANPNARPVDIKTLNEMWHRLEAAAGISPVPGRAWYGLRRANADIAEPTALRIGYDRGLPLEEMAVLMLTNHARDDRKDMQRHYRARADQTVDLDNLYLREELERPQAKYVQAKLKAHRGGGRHPRVYVPLADTTTDTPTDTQTSSVIAHHTTDSET